MAGAAGDAGDVFPLNGSNRIESPVGQLLGPVVGLEGTMRTTAGRKRHSAEDLVRKLRRADKLAAKDKTSKEMPTIGFRQVIWPHRGQADSSQRRNTEVVRRLRWLLCVRLDVA